MAVARGLPIRLKPVPVIHCNNGRKK
jgi:hypothetical protein